MSLLCWAQALPVSPHLRVGVQLAAENNTQFEGEEMKELGNSEGHSGKLD